MWIAIIIIVVLLVFVVVNVVVLRELLDRQKRIMQMKRFRNSARAQKADFSPEDKRTMI
jgi:uncharacterized membrane protein